MARTKQTPRKLEHGKPAKGGERKKPKWKWTTSCRRKMVKLQRDPGFQIPKAAVCRAVKDVFQTEAVRFGGAGAFRIRKGALMALHTSAEEMLTDVLRKADKYADNAGRVTVQPKDLKAAVEDFPNLFWPDIKAAAAELKRNAPPA